VVQLDYSNEDVPIEDSHKKLIVTGPSSSNVEATSPPSKQQKTTFTPVVLVPTSSPIFELLPKLLRCYEYFRSFVFPSYIFGFDRE